MAQEKYIPFDKSNVLNAQQEFDTVTKKRLNFESWAKFLAYYRYYPDKFAVDILGITTLYPFQKLLIRAAFRYEESDIVASRGLTKSFISAIIMVIQAILYPSSKIGICAKQGSQSKKIIVKKIVGELMEYPAIKNEIEHYGVSNDPFVRFKNGSSIFTIVLGVGSTGDGARGDRTNFLIIDEANYVSFKVLEAVVFPMNNNIRYNLLMIKEKFPNETITETNKIICLTSAGYKISEYYTRRFSKSYDNMTTGEGNLFCCAFDYTVGEKYGIYPANRIQREKERLPAEKFAMEYEARFVGSSAGSYFPYELTMTSRTIKTPELQQPKNSQSQYVIMHDVAVSDAKGSDNCATHVIKLRQKANGTYDKDVVYSVTGNGRSLQQQRDLLRELIHIKFPNTIKLVYDARSVGYGLMALFEDVWEYTTPKGDVVEYPPLIPDDDVDKQILFKNALPLIRPVQASEQYNMDSSSYTKLCFENGTLRLMVSEENIEDTGFTEDIESEAYQLYSRKRAVHIEHDILIAELSNLATVINPQTSKMTIRRIVQGTKRDRATSLMYGLQWISEKEEENKQILSHQGQEEDITSYLGFW